MPDPRPDSVELLIPCHNEAPGIPQLFTELDAALPAIRAAATGPVRVLLFDNGSSDETRSALEHGAASRPGYHVHHSPENLGIGGALRASLSLTDADVIVTMDSDCTYAPSTVPRLLNAIAAGADIVTGSPYHPSGSVENVPVWRLALSKGLSHVYRRVAPVKVWTYTAMFRAHRRTALESIRWKSDGFLSTTEILVEAAAAGYRIDEIPATLSSRRFGVSKIRTVQVGRDHLAYIFDIGLRRLRGVSGRPVAEGFEPHPYETRRTEHHS